ncbi:MAG: histidine kinase [Burkholderiaceae bacterium]|jgi:signal transduction histidine kinase|nr:histidine kinase [Burkholderiaceae bacterium]MCZ8176657.1 histidine kinase [Burkholderiaceae bacterium]
MAGWRRRVLLALALLACVAGAAMLRLLAATPMIDVAATATADGRLLLDGGGTPQLQALQGRALLAVGVPGAPPVAVDADLLHRVPRWQTSDERRAATLAQQDALTAALAGGTVALHLDGGLVAEVPATPRGLARIGLLTWPLVAAALLLPLSGAVVLLSQPSLPSALLMLLCMAQALGLGFVAAGTVRGLGLPPGLLALEMPARLALDAASAAAVVHAFLVGRRPAWAVAVWLCTALAVAAVALGTVSPAWPWAQSLCGLLGVLALVAAWRPPAGAPDPRRRVAARLTLMALLTWLLANAVVMLSAGRPALAAATAAGASVAWALSVTTLLLLVPFLARSRRLLRELALLAGIGCLAASLDLLFVAVFAVNAQASMAVAVFVALGVYAYARQRLLEHLLGMRLLTTDRIFELLYRAARDVQRRPERRLQRLAQLLRELFEPLEMTRHARVPAQAEVHDGGAALVVPLRAEGEGRTGLAVQLRLAGRGQRLFMPEDARLADRVVEQLRRAVAYDRAVERGRHEERRRLAQDLHDDIGARLLTLMYQAPTPELEDYIRHTLQDLKTLTRGLAVAEHRLGPAAVEWKSDLGHRLAVARTELEWHCDVDEARVLTVVQWSALTRVLRELVTNSLYHGRAQRVAVSLAQAGNALTLVVADDGVGRDPAGWAHGLGLGGVRKRVKQLGGRVEWRENGERGIVCRVEIDRFGEAA